MANPQGHLILPMLLSINGGYVDTAGFLALQGLFTAHVTGNFVTLGAALVLGTSGVLAKLLALPVFCSVVILARLSSYGIRARGWPVLRTLLSVKVLLLIIAAVLAIRLGPFANGDTWPAVLTGMTLVAAMAIQNAVHRVHLASSPPTTLMTGTTTQMMLDVADLIEGAAPPATRARLARMATSVAAFAGGCALAALLFALLGVWCFVMPPIVGIWTLLLRVAVAEAEHG